jgi:hypothetical protein
MIFSETVTTCFLQNTVCSPFPLTRGLLCSSSSPLSLSLSSPNNKKAAAAAAAAMRPFIRTARCCLRVRVHTMATLPVSPAAISTSTTSRPLSSLRPHHRLLLARFLHAGLVPAGARALRTSTAAAASAVKVGGVKIAREGELGARGGLKV